MFCHHPAHMVLTAVPGTLVLRLFLTPDCRLEVFHAVHDFQQALLRERIQLLDTDNGDVLYAICFTFLEQIVVDLATAQNKSFYCRRIGHGVITEHGLETALGKIIQRRYGTFVAQQALRAHYHQRLA